jgi:ferredoxin
MKPYLIEKKCPAVKEMCKAIAACSREAIRYLEDEDAPLGGRIVFDHEKCDGCGLCVTACCGNAVELR